jgi:hypothetical protein
MNFRKPLVAAAAISALMSVCAPAQAFSFLGATSNSDGSFSFAKDTKVEFDFFASHGAYQSNFNVYGSGKNLLTTLFKEEVARDPLPGPKPDYNKNDSKGTCGITVLPVPCQTTFTFAKGVSYFLGLTGGSKAVYTGDLTTYSKDDAKAETFKFVNGGEQFVYYTSYKDGSLDKRKKELINVEAGTTLIAVNDSWNGDADYNDFIVKAKKSAAVPEPGTVGALLGAGALGLINRRRKASEAEKA